MMNDEQQRDQIRTGEEEAFRAQVPFSAIKQYLRLFLKVCL